MGAIAEVRAEIHAALATAVDVPVYRDEPGGVPAPCIILLPGSPYLDPGASWGGMTVGLDVRLVVNDYAGAGTGPALDDLLDAVVAALVAVDGVQVSTVGPPTPEPDQGVLVVDVPTLTTWKDS